jgi:bleomycin hydrolase
MRNKALPFVVLLATLLVFSAATSAEEEKDDKKDPSAAYEFTVEVEVDRTPVKNQYRTGTCWCFATISFLESELLRTGKGEFDLSEMFVVRNTYPHKADNFIRLHGTANFSQGGQAHDVMNCVRRYGLVPESAYSGMEIEESRHNHGEMVSVLTAMMDAVLNRNGKRVTPRWSDALEAVLDVYLGRQPEVFTFDGEEYTPKSFNEKVLKIDPDDYVELTSYSHNEFYTQCRLEIPDNWDYNGEYYNLPIDDLERIIEHALENGHSVVWDGDVSEEEFNSKKLGYAVVPEIAWEDRLHEEQELKEVFTGPVKEKAITQEDRQKTLDNFTTTDDHLMHIVGLASDQEGTRFYLTKNSGGVDRKNDGYMYMSQAFVRLKTTAILVNKAAIPEDITSKLGL